MQGVRICIVGSEILNGFILDTNTRFFSEEMYKLGLPVKEVRIIGDDPEKILQTWGELFATGDLVINSGGLGPTDDDLTVDLLCQYLECKAVYDTDAEKRLRFFFRKRSNPGQSRQEKEETLQRALRQVRVPEKAQALKNRVGLAPGIFVPGIPLVALPGFPIEVKSIWPGALEHIKAFAQGQSLTREISIWGVGESTLFAGLPPFGEVEVGVHALPLGCRLFLRADRAEQFEPLESAIRQKYGACVVNDPLVEFFEFMKSQNQTFGTVESCTGGLLAKLFTDIPGSSSVYKGSVVTYANEVKQNLAGVNSETITSHGAVSAECAGEMASNARQALQVDYCVATTGIAGPSGGSKEKPVGTCYIALASEGETLVGRFMFPLGRERFRNAVCYSAMLALYQRFVFYKEAEKFAASELGSYYTGVRT